MVVRPAVRLLADYLLLMRLHVVLPDAVVHELDRRVGPRSRSAYIARAVERELENEGRWELVESALGAIPDHGHAWDSDAGGWVRSQRGR
jgi:hypothetical protein